MTQGGATRRAQPENVRIAFDGHVKLIDLASAAHMPGRIGERAPPPLAGITLTGTLSEYTAPEILVGARAVRRELAQRVVEPIGRAGPAARGSRRLSITEERALGYARAWA